MTVCILLLFVLSVDICTGLFVSEFSVICHILFCVCICGSCCCAPAYLYCGEVWCTSAVILFCLGAVMKCCRLAFIGYWVLPLLVFMFVCGSSVMLTFFFRFGGFFVFLSYKKIDALSL